MEGEIQNERLIGQSVEQIQQKLEIHEFNEEKIILKLNLPSRAEIDRLLPPQSVPGIKPEAQYLSPGSQRGQQPRTMVAKGNVPGYTIVSQSQPILSLPVRSGKPGPGPVRPVGKGGIQAKSQFGAAQPPFNGQNGPADGYH